MTRWIITMAVLLGGAISVAHADYLRIIYNLNAAKADPNQQPMNPGVVPPGGVPTPPGAPSPPGGKPPGGGLPTPPPPRPNPPPQTPGTPPNPGNPPPALPPGLPPILGRLLANPEDDESVIEAGVVVEYKKFDSMIGRDNGAVYNRIYHKWGATALIPVLPDIRIEFLSEDGQKIPTVTQRYELQRKVKLKGAKTAEAILQLAEWTLNHADIADPDHRMFKQFASLMGELRELDAKHPAVVAFDKVEAALDAGVAGDDTAIIWKDRLDNYKAKRSKHYTLLYDSPSGVPDEADAYLDQLEENMRGFFYWFAMKGHALRVPDRRLVAVLVAKSDEFQAYRDAFDRVRVVADGFYSRRENLAVFCGTRQDEVYTVLRNNTNSLWTTGWNAKDLLKGKGHAGAKSSEENVKNQMLALLLKAMGEESIRASVGQDGTRQLLVATGLLTTTVEAPEWIQFGTGSFFETPVGAYWPGMGAPHWTYMVKFKLWKKDDDAAQAASDAARAERKPPIPFVRKLDPAPVAIRHVITDQYFRDARQNERKKSIEAKARTMSWSLAYFLMNKKLDMLLRYYEELRNLPRDMVPDDETLTRCFGRAFELMEPADPTRVDDRLLNKLADEWYSFIELTPMESSEALQEAWRNLKAMQDKTKAGAKPGSAVLTTPGGKKPGSGNNPPTPPPPGNAPPGGKPPSGG